MEDSTATTIEFLRARLLAERSVSRTARQRAYELAKRVTELEKQLKFVSLQRKKAEKAAVDVLAILENHGRSDISETFDSSSDQEEVSSDFKDGKQVETSEHVKVLESDAEGFSGSEVESSSVNGKSLSWKSSKNSLPRFLEKKYMDTSRSRRSNSFASTGSSPRRVGKSCRQIRRREHRSVADGSENDDTSDPHCEDEVVQNSADMAIRTSTEELKTCEEKDPLDIPTSSGILQNHGVANGHTVERNGADEDMERALEHQARFIARYEAEERAQREWEDKFRENGSVPDSCDPGTNSDVTEERDEVKCPAPDLVPAPPHSNDQSIPETREIDANEPKTASPVQPTLNIDTAPLLDHKGVSDDQNHPDMHGASGNFSPAQAASSKHLMYRGEQTSGKLDESALGNHENTETLGSVLEALQQAKLSLKQNLHRFPVIESGPSVPTYRSGEKFPVPFSSPGLFRLPTEYEYGGATTTRVNSLSYDSRLSLTNYPTEPPGGRFVGSPYRETFSRSAALLDDRFRMVPTFPYQETSPGIPPQRPSTLDPRLDVRSPARDRRLDVGVGKSTLDRRLTLGLSARDPRLDVGRSALDPRLDVGVGQSVLDPRLSMRQSALDPRLDVGVGQFALDPRLSLGQSPLDPRMDVGAGQSALDPRLSLGQSTLALDPRLDVGVGQSAQDPRLSMGQFALDPRPDVGVGPFSVDPRFEMGSPFMGNRYIPDRSQLSAGLPSSSTYTHMPVDGRVPRSFQGAEIPLRTRSLYDDNYTRPDTHG